MARPTLLDVAKSQGDDGLAGLIEEVLPAVPELVLAPTKPIKGIQYKTNVRIGLASGGFRNANQGVATTKSVFENRLFNCFIANSIWQCDKAVADAHEEGAAAYISAEAAGVLQGQLIHIGKQFYYGVGNDDKGFPGLQALYDATKTVDAAGTTANTGSSVWAVKWGPMGVQLLLGNNSQLQLSDVKEVVTADANSLPLTVYHQELLAWIGLQLGSIHGAGRIKNLTADATKGLTDARLGALFTMFPVGYKPDVFLMSRRSQEQLRASRTATNPTGAEAPYPTDWNGVRIEVTDSILDTEAIA